MATQPLGISYAFDGKNEAAQAMVDAYRRDYKWKIAKETRQAINMLVERSIREGIAPRDAARLIKRHIGLDSQRMGALMGYRDRLAKSGLAMDKMHKALDRYGDKLLRARAETIARTETMAALNSGTIESWREASKSGFRVEAKEWIATPDELSCPTCSGLHGEVALLDQPFSTGHDFPPAHPRCRCAMSVARASEVRLGKGLFPQPGLTSGKKLRDVEDWIKKLHEQDLVTFRQAHPWVTDAEIDEWTKRRWDLIEKKNINVSWQNGQYRFTRPGATSMSEMYPTEIRNCINNVFAEVEDAVANLEPIGAWKNKRIPISVDLRPKTGAWAWGGPAGIDIDLEIGYWQLDRAKLLEHMRAGAKPGTSYWMSAAEKVRFHPTGEPGSIFCHELAHVIHLSGKGHDLYGAFTTGADGFLTWQTKAAGKWVTQADGTSVWQNGYAKWHRANPEFAQKWITKIDDVTLEVGRYANKNPLEFVAEVMSAHGQGMKFSDDVEELYRILHGPVLKYLKKKAVTAAVKVAEKQTVTGVVSELSSLLPKTAKGLPIPEAEKDLVRRVLQLRAEGKGYKAIEELVPELKVQNGNNAWKIVNKYGAGRIIEGSKTLGGDLAETVVKKVTSGVLIPEGPKGDVIRRCIELRKEGKTFSQIDEIVYGKPPGNSGSRSFTVIKKYKEADNL